MAAAPLNLTIEQGSTFRFSLTWSDTFNVPIDLTGYTARMHIRDVITNPVFLLELTTGNGRIAITPLLGKIELILSDTITAAITWTSGVYDLEIISPAGEVTRLVQGTVTVSPEVTRP